MKFSYKSLKELVPKIKSEDKLAELLNEKVFEVEGVVGDSIDISMPPNRYADSSGHWGIAREISASIGSNFDYPALKEIPLDKNSDKLVKVHDVEKCPRYIGGVFFDVSVIDTPNKIKNILESCGIQSINNVVDIMNYVMIETGQPMHAFDLDEVKGKIHARVAKKGEKMTTLDGKRIIFAGDELVIADDEGPLAIAGIKGGDRAGVDEKTKKIFVESAMFDSLSTYATSRNIGITTDASLRFSREMSRNLPEIGFRRAMELLEEMSGAKLESWQDTQTKEPPKRVVLFNVKKFNDFIGVDVSSTEILDMLNNLGFKIITKEDASLDEEFFVEAPPLRVDIGEFVDVAEEVVRIYGLNNVKPISPKISISSDLNEDIIFIDKVKDSLVKMGFSEVFLTSFLPRGYASITKDDMVELEAPPSENYCYLRPTLEAGFIEAMEKNLKHFDRVAMFETGKVFEMNKGEISEKMSLGIGYGSKKDEDVEFITKGAVVSLFKALGLTEWSFIDNESDDEKYSHSSILKISLYGKEVGWLCALSLGEDKKFGYAEIDMEKMFEIEEGEYEYTEIPKFPVSERDLSMLVDKNQKIGKLIEEISLADVGVIRDVDLIDEYEGENVDSGKMSVTFRIVFQSDEKTLKDKEVDEVIDKIKKSLKSKFSAEIRD